MTESVAISYDSVKLSIMAPTKVKLVEMYVEQGFTQQEIAEKYDVHQTTVSNWLDKYGVDTGGQYSGLLNDRVEYAGFNPCDASGYERWRCWNREKEDNEQVYVHRLLAVSEFGFDAVAGRHVHHENGCPFDNRPENIELVTNSEHRTIHNTERYSSA